MLWGSVHKCSHTSCKPEHARFIASARVYDLYTRICARIFMKFETKAHKIVIDHQMKFHEDLSFCCGDVCKTILVFFNLIFDQFWPIGSMFLYHLYLEGISKSICSNLYLYLYLHIQKYRTRCKNEKITISYSI